LSDPRIVIIRAGPTGLGAGCGDRDYSAMRGAEFVDNVLLSEPETVWIPPGE
jgi:hypothetical protein